MLSNDLQDLGYQIAKHREHLGLSQQQLAIEIGEDVNRSNIAHLEQGRKFPKIDIFEKICLAVKLPNPIWKPFMAEKVQNRLDFESLLGELFGDIVTTKNLDETTIRVIEDKIDLLFSGSYTPTQLKDCLNSIIVYYGHLPLSNSFFSRYLKKDSFKDLASFEMAINNFQKDAIRVFSSINEAYNQLSSANEEQFDARLNSIEIRNTDDYTTRTEWDRIIKIPNQELPYLGYISADRVKKESKERKELSDFLLEIAGKKADGNLNMETYSKKKRNRMDSLARKFNSRIGHGFISPMFVPDVDILRKEAEYILPEKDENLQKMEKTQNTAYHNLTNYLTADYLDVYVATSMRSFADFVSVNEFVETLFSHKDLKQLKLRYFNPTQSWIEDRVAKGLVEALMLKRADICIYMAQKEDTFGKDSEASVTLGQGKPVIVYVPKLYDKDTGIDSEHFGRMERGKLIEEILKIDPKAMEEIDDSEDTDALHSTLLHKKLSAIKSQDYVRMIKNHWADFDIEGEFDKRLKEDERAMMRKLFEGIMQGNSVELIGEQMELFKDILVSSSIRFERRAKVFREVHPLALQIILSSGVLNGILVVRSVDSCAKLVNSLIENKLDLALVSDENNYKLIEKNTLSTIRVISKHRLISNSFRTFYMKQYQ